MRRPGDWPASQIELLMSLDQYGRQIVDASGVTPERGRVAHLHLTTDPAHSGEPSRMVIPLDAVRHTRTCSLRRRTRWRR